MSIYITGDKHGDISWFYNDENIKNITKDDYLIICGDFGFIWRDDGVEHNYLDYLNHLGFKILFIDGNHENFNKLNKFSTKDWNGGKIHTVRKNVYHLMRGYVFTIEGKKFFTMGGATSKDSARRIPNKSWWTEEIPEHYEWLRAMKNLEKHNMKVDYVITHCIYYDIMKNIIVADKFEDDIMRNLKDISDKISFAKWFFGHYHTPYNDGTYQCLYNEIVKI